VPTCTWIRPATVSIFQVKLLQRLYLHGIASASKSKLKQTTNAPRQATFSSEAKASTRLIALA
jgi:hypothetical protein